MEPPTTADDLDTLRNLLESCRALAGHMRGLSRHVEDTERCDVAISALLAESLRAESLAAMSGPVMETLSLARDVCRQAKQRASDSRIALDSKLHECLVQCAVLIDHAEMDSTALRELLAVQRSDTTANEFEQKIIDTAERLLDAITIEIRHRNEFGQPSPRPVLRSMPTAESPRTTRRSTEPANYFRSGDASKGTWTNPMSLRRIAKAINQDYRQVQSLLQGTGLIQKARSMWVVRTDNIIIAQWATQLDKASNEPRRRSATHTVQS